MGRDKDQVKAQFYPSLKRFVDWCVFQAKVAGEQIKPPFATDFNLSVYLAQDTVQFKKGGEQVSYSTLNGIRNAVVKLFYRELAAGLTCEEHNPEK